MAMEAIMIGVKAVETMAVNNVVNGTVNNPQWKLDPDRAAVKHPQVEQCNGQCDATRRKAVQAVSE
jgi:hypothetical protein